MAKFLEFGLVNEMKNVINIGTLLHVTENLIFEDDKKVNMVITICEDDKDRILRFENVSSIKMSSFSYQMVIGSMEIVDHKDDGWSIEKRFEVKDYEEGSLSFFCENYTID